MVIFARLMQIFLFFLSFKALPYSATHLIRPHSSFEQVALNSSCSTIRYSRFSTRCHPALFPYNRNASFEVALVGKASGDSIENGYHLLFEPITEDFLRGLFNQGNFNSFTFNSDLLFLTKWFEVVYSPYYLLADIYFFNPVFPEVSINAANRESLRLTSGVELGEVPFLKDSKISVGGSVYYYRHSYANTVFSLVDLSTQRLESLIHFEDVKGMSGDAGFSLFWEQFYIPNISWQIKNINSKIKRNASYEGSPHRIQSRYLFETYSSLGIGKSFKTNYGGFDVNWECPFDKVFFRDDREYSALGLRYNLNLFSILMGLGKYYQNIGGKFESQNFNIGLSYAQEKDLGPYSVKKEHSVYSGLEIKL